MQYFPLELSNIDYFHRIFYILSTGLKPIITDFLNQKNKLLDVPLPHSHDVNNSYDSSCKDSMKKPSSTSKRNTFHIYSNDTTNRRTKPGILSQGSDKLLNSTIHSFPSVSNNNGVDPLIITQLELQNVESGNVTHESSMKSHQFMKISSKSLSLEEMLIIILGLRINQDSRTSILGFHAKVLGFHSIEEMVKPLSLLLQWFRYIQRQTSVCMIDTGTNNS